MTFKRAFLMISLLVLGCSAENSADTAPDVADVVQDVGSDDGASVADDVQDAGSDDDTSDAPIST